MLRWCQSTVRILDGYGNSTQSSIRFYSKLSTHKRAHDVRADETARGDQSTGRPCKVVTYSAGAKSAGGWEYTRHALSKSTPSSGTSSRATQGQCTTTTPIIPQSYNGSSGKLEALETVISFLSSNSSHSARPTRLSAHTLKSLYGSIKTQSELHRLNSKHLTALISFLGSSSLPTPRAPCIYLSKLVSPIDEPPTQTHWPSVLEIARDKENLGLPLSGTDRYWIMRAQLAEIKVVDGEKLQPGDPKLQALSRATNQYLRIWRHTPDPEVHLPIFDALFSLDTPEHTVTLARRLSMVLELYPNPHSRFIDMLFQIVLKRGHCLNPQAKERILGMIPARLEKFNSVSLRPQNDHTLPNLRDVSKGLKPPGLSISDLSAALGATVFPSYSNKHVPAEVCQWARVQAVRAFAPETSSETRWTNILLLAIHKNPSVHAQGLTSFAEQPNPTGVAGWRTVFTLSMLDCALKDMIKISPKAQDNVQNIVRPLWRMWKAEFLSNRHQLHVATRLMMVAFFRISASICDGPLNEACFRFCADHRLFTSRRGAEAWERALTTDLIIGYVLGLTSCTGMHWPEIFSSLVEVVPGIQWREGVVEALLRHFIPRDAEATLGLFTFSKSNGLHLSDSVMHATSMSLATPQTWGTAVPFLRHPRFSHSQIEELLGAILRVFQVERYIKIDSYLADVLGTTMENLYTGKAPSDRMKYPVRFFFSIMIFSGHASKAIGLLETIHRKAPSFFNTRLYLRLMQALVRCRQLHLTTRLLRFVPAPSTPAGDDFRRKLGYSLARAGADVLSRRVYEKSIGGNVRRSTREVLTRLVSFRPHSPNRRLSLGVLPTLARNPSAHSIKYATTILVNAQRSYAARKLYEKTHDLLDGAMKTSIGNIILHGSIIRRGLSNGRLVRHILRTKIHLEQKYGFVGDRATVNIVLKAMLRWRNVIDPPKLKALFDHMVRGGYPASPRWCQHHGVPFGTPPSASSSSSYNVNLTALPSAISFERHVRPMYKMFIKAFYVRHDVAAAKMIVGILKEEESLAIRRREVRDRARRWGLVRKRLRVRDHDVPLHTTSCP